jgi:DNA primase catalytic subunit
LAFLFQLVLEEADHKSHQAFFQDLQALTRYLVFESWERLLDFMSQGLELVMPANSS